MFPLQPSRFVNLLYRGGLVGLLGMACLAEAQDHATDGKVAHVQAQAQAETTEAKLTPEQRLDAIRRALVKATLQGATKVETVSWIDENGVLRDSATFHSNMRVRGVQVLAYGKNELGEPEADLGLPAAQSEDLVKSQTLSAEASKVAALANCPRPVPGMRQIIGVDVVLSDRWEAAELGVAKTLVGWAMRELAPSTAPWTLLQRPAPAANAYESALLSTPLDQIPWRARLNLTPLSVGKIKLSSDSVSETGFISTTAWRNSLEQPAAADNSPEYPMIQVKWQWQVVHMPSSEPLIQESGVQDIVVRKAEWEPWVADPLSQPAVSKMLLSWVDKMRQTLACELMEAQVTQAQGQEISLNVGGLSGVKVGDAWLVADLPQVTLHTLEPDALSKLVLAEVKQVFPNSARLKIVAGQAKEVQRHWKAWPADALTLGVQP